MTPAEGRHARILVRLGRVTIGSAQLRPSAHEGPCHFRTRFSPRELFFGWTQRGSACGCVRAIGTFVPLTAEQREGPSTLSGIRDFARRVHTPTASLSREANHPRATTRPTPTARERDPDGRHAFTRTRKAEPCAPRGSRVAGPHRPMLCTPQLSFKDPTTTLRFRPTSRRLGLLSPRASRGCRRSCRQVGHVPAR